MDTTHCGIQNGEADSAGSMIPDTTTACGDLETIPLEDLPLSPFFI